MKKKEEMLKILQDYWERNVRFNQPHNYGPRIVDYYTENIPNDVVYHLIAQNSFGRIMIGRIYESQLKREGYLKR